MRVMSLDADAGAPAAVEASVCIIGAGAAGLYLAHRLARYGANVVVLEAGPKTPVPPANAGFDCEFPTTEYRGATEGRALGLGGTTSRWGGQLIAFPPGDGVRDDAVMRGVWQHILEVGERYGRDVARVVGIDESVAHEGLAVDVTAEFHAAGLSPRQSRWLPFRKRNFSWMTQAPQGTDEEARVYCGAVAAAWSLEQGNDGLCRIREVIARSRSGRTRSVKAQQYVIAAGTLESTRLLLEIDAAGDGRVVPAGNALGRYLSDHLSFRIAEFGTSARARAARVFGPCFSRNCMRTWRFVEEAPESAHSRYFAHVIFPTENPGFQLARSVLQALQAGKVPSVGIRALGRGSMGALRIAWYRWAQSRLYIADDAPCYLQLDMEQRPQSCNSIRLGRSMDRFGRPVAIIDWSVREQDEADMAHARSTFLSRWSKLDLGLPLRPVEAADGISAKPHDAYHPVGTCRMGEDREAVVGFDLKVHGTENLFALSTAIYPSAGSANPTLNLLCFAEMLADQLGKSVAMKANREGS